jgi:hypothetical protein
MVKAKINDPDLTSYIKSTEKKMKEIKSLSGLYLFVRTYDYYFKMLASLVVLFLMVNHVFF